jgi:hypothetical protein
MNAPSPAIACGLGVSYMRYSWPGYFHALPALYVAINGNTDLKHLRWIAVKIFLFISISVLGEFRAHHRFAQMLYGQPSSW